MELNSCLQTHEIYKLIEVILQHDVPTISLHFKKRSNNNNKLLT